DRATFRLRENAMKTLPINVLKPVAAAVLALMALSAAGADKLNVKLGLWEITSLSRFSGMPPLPKDVLDKMTPQQRADMEAKIKAAAAEEPEPEVSSECITQDDLDKPFNSANAEECTQTIVRTTRNTQEIRLACSGKVKGAGTFRIVTPTPESMTGDLDLKVGEGASAMSITSKIKGRWLGADCGDEEDGDADDEDETAEQ
ncbi:MAG: DUF3617 domain-containing protein, partial [Steroidobacter sp.]